MFFVSTSIFNAGLQGVDRMEACLYGQGVCHFLAGRCLSGGLHSHRSLQATLCEECQVTRNQAIARIWRWRPQPRTRQ